MKRSKYGSKKVVVDGHTFDSKAEAKRYGELKLLEQQGIISNLSLQYKIPLTVCGNGHAPSSVGTYRADFAYFCGERMEWIYEDVKGHRTQLYKLKKRIVEANGITITEIPVR